MADQRWHADGQRNKVLAMQPEIAEASGILRRAPVLRILRCYWDGAGNIFEISLSHHPGDRFAYSMDIDLNG